MRLPEDPRRLAPVLWMLLATFLLRVVGQVLVAFADVSWLPPMEQWQSGLLPYPWLLAGQFAVLVLMIATCVDFTRGTGPLVRTRPVYARGVLVFGYLYLAVMVVRYPVQMALHPEDRWFGRTIPIVLHWVLATFVILFGRFHRRRLSESVERSA